jgi:hypothetical protein
MCNAKATAFERLYRVINDVTARHQSFSLQIGSMM